MGLWNVPSVFFQVTPLSCDPLTAETTPGTPAEIYGFTDRVNVRPLWLKASY